MGSRRRGREAALQMLYQIDVSGVTAEQAVQSYWAYLGANREGEEFATEIVRGWASQRDRIDGVIRGLAVGRGGRAARAAHRCAWRPGAAPSGRADCGRSRLRWPRWPCGSLG